MPILTSQIITATEQQDGSRSVHERHTDHNGKSYDVVYFAPVGMDIDLVLASRAAKMGAEIDAKQAAEAESANYTLPLTKKQFLDLFTVTEYATIKAAAAANATLDYYWQKLMVAESVYLSDPQTIGGINLLEQAGLIAPGRAAEILGA
jgi:hypothetical protein